MADDDPAEVNTWDLRPDGTPKGLGFLGVVKRPSGGVMSEFSVGVPINGQETDIPTFVPTLTASELHTLLTLPEGKPVPSAIVHKAVTHALGRLQRGLPIFAQEGEQQEWIYPQFERAAVRMPSGDIRLPNMTGPAKTR